MKPSNNWESEFADFTSIQGRKKKRRIWGFSIQPFWEETSFFDVTSQNIYGPKWSHINFFGRCYTPYKQMNWTSSRSVTLLEEDTAFIWERIALFWRSLYYNSPQWAPIRQGRVLPWCESIREHPSEAANLLRKNDLTPKNVITKVRYMKIHGTILSTTEEVSWCLPLGVVGITCLWSI